MTSHLLSLHDCYDSRLIQKEKYHCPKWTTVQSGPMKRAMMPGHLKALIFTTQVPPWMTRDASCPRLVLHPMAGTRMSSSSPYTSQKVFVCVCINVYIIIISIYPPSPSFLDSIIQNDGRKKNANVLLGDFSSTGSRDPDPSIGPDSSLRALRRRSAFRMAKVNLDRWILNGHRLPLQCRHRSI